MELFICLLLLTLLLAGLPPTRSSEEKSPEQQVGALISDVLARSDSRVRPNVSGAPVSVGVDFFVSSISSINAQDMDVEVDVYFRQRWVDARLAFPAQPKPIVLAPSWHHQIWAPDVYFPNEKSGTLHRITVVNKSLKIFHNGTVLSSSRLTLKLNCPMTLSHFPMDNQQCFIRVSCYSYDLEDVTLFWQDDDPLEINHDELTLPQFELTGTFAESCDENYKTGTFACLKAVLELRRQFGFYLLQTYIPSVLIVVISWLAFWIDKEAIPARCSLGVTTVLTMTTQLSSSRSSNMTVSYAKAIDVWYAFCMIIVFASLCQFSFVNALHRRQKNRNRRAGGRQHVEPTVPSYAPPGGAPPRRLRVSVGLTGAMTADGLDRVARVGFPLAFATFNAVYWTYYTIT